MYYRYAAYNSKSSRKKTQSQVPVVEYPIADVFAAAAAAQRVNGEYVKESRIEYRKVGNNEEAVQITPNKILIRKFLSDSADQITDDDRNEGAAVRSYWKLKMFALLQGNASDYISKAVELASKETIASNDALSLALISSLPAGYIRGMERDVRDEVKQDAVLLSEYQGREGDRIKGRVQVLDCIYSQKWLCYYVTGKIGNNVFMWASKSEINSGSEFELQGRVKRHRDNNITQLNYVRLK